MNISTPKNVPSFCDFLREKVGRNWVLARRTSRIVERYGEDVVCISQKQYTELELAFERLTGQSASDPREPSRFLKAAAPDLLAALKLVVNRTTANFTLAEWDQLRAAIAKAEGRQ